MSNIQLTDDAREDLTASAKYYESKQIGLGSDFLDEVEKALEQIKQNPNQFPIIYKNVRKALVGRFPYKLLFIVKSIGIIIFSVFHTSQNPEKWKKRADNEN